MKKIFLFMILIVGLVSLNGCGNSTKGEEKYTCFSTISSNESSITYNFIGKVMNDKVKSFDLTMEFSDEEEAKMYASTLENSILEGGSKVTLKNANDNEIYKSFDLINKTREEFKNKLSELFSNTHEGFSTTEIVCK